MVKIAIIHGYGRMTDDEFSCLYADKLVKYLNDGMFDVVVSSGGFTDSMIHESESQSIKNIIEPRLILKNYQWLLEEKSFTTYENVIQCKDIIKQFRQRHIVVFCMNTHLPKIAYLSLQNYCGLTKEQTLTTIQKDLQNNKIQYQGDCIYETDGISFVGFDLLPEFSSYGKAIWSSIIETHYDEYPNLHDDFVEFRKKIRNLK